jgi:hypothetical protein
MPQADRTPGRVNRDSELSDLASGQSPRTWPDELDALSPLEVLRIAGKAGAEVVARLVTEPAAGPAGIARAAFPARCGVSARASGRPADRPRAAEQRADTAAVGEVQRDGIGPESARQRGESLG